MGPLNNPLPKAEVTNTAAVIVTYYPDEDFGERLTELRKQFAAVYWVDNTPGATVGTKHLSDPDVNYISQGVNAGLGTALNMGCMAALKDGFEWAVTFDQDSDFVPDFLCQHIAAWQESDSSAFILGCNYSAGDNVDKPRFRVGDYMVVCKTVITSGCLMCLPVWDDLGRFRDDYFIDGIDHEICLRGRSKGLVIVLASDPQIIEFFLTYIHRFASTTACVTVHRIFFDMPRVNRYGRFESPRRLRGKL
jgi:rhamnosyltransferase